MERLGQNLTAKTQLLLQAERPSSQNHLVVGQVRTGGGLPIWLSTGDIWRYHSKCWAEMQESKVPLTKIYTPLLEPALLHLLSGCMFPTTEDIPAFVLVPWTAKNHCVLSRITMTGPLSHTLGPK